MAVLGAELRQRTVRSRERAGGQREPWNETDPLAGRLVQE